MHAVDGPPPEHTAIEPEMHAGFAARFGHAPTTIYRAPGRVNVIGEHLDYNGGCVLPMALEQATYAAAGPRPDGVLRMASAQQEESFEARLDAIGPGRIHGWARYAAGAVWALREDGIPVGGLDVLIDSRVPIGAGLSSSAALICSVALAACGTAGLTDDTPLRERVVRACVRAENEVAGAATGGMDQMTALFARAGHLMQLDCRDWSRRQIPWPDGDAEILVVDTKASHSLDDGGYGSRRRDCEQAAAALGVPLLRDVAHRSAALRLLSDERVRRRVRHVLTEMTRVDDAVARLTTADFAGLGELLTASHASLRDDFEVSCTELDVTVEAALAAGALGARMTGGGFGGSAIALVERESRSAVERAVLEAFARRGWPEPGLLLARPSAGADLVSGR
ncbi:MAG TPA: galactokinase [Nocardioidaceae bacterium]|nr:galactokinase [Nocardioidaceae bacterium]